MRVVLAFGVLAVLAMAGHASADGMFDGALAAWDAAAQGAANTPGQTFGDLAGSEQTLGDVGSWGFGQAGHGATTLGAQAIDALPI